MAKKSKSAFSKPQTKSPPDLDHGPIPVPFGWRPSSKSSGYYEFDDGAKPKLRTAHFSDYILAMQEASFHFGIDAPAGKYPKVEELWDYFRGHKRSDGAPFSEREVKSMSTFCRPPKAKDGGAHPQKKRRLTP
jgi:hypothetical protein